MNIEEVLQSLGEEQERVLKEAIKCKTAEEILALASKNNLSISETEAKEILDKLQIKSGELSDNELDMVTGGGAWNKFGTKYCPGPANYTPAKCMGSYCDQVEFLAKDSDGCQFYKCKLL